MPDDLLETASLEEISQWLAHYVAETRNTRGEPHPPKNHLPAVSWYSTTFATHTTA